MNKTKLIDSVPENGNTMRYAKASCTWRENWDSLWDTDCDDQYEFLYEGPFGNHFTYCPFCGGKIQEIFFKGPNAT